MAEVAAILEDVPTAVLATRDEQGTPRMRWMTPAILRDRPGAVYALTSPAFAKSAHIRSAPKVEWMFQTRALDVVITLRGSVNLLDNPSIRSEVLEVVGPRLTAFWKISDDERDLTVLETVISEGTYYRTMKGEKHVVAFDQEAEERSQP